MRILTNDHIKVEGLRYKDEKGLEKYVRGTHYILALGGIETPKLLLYSGVGNSIVGKNLMDHPALSFTFLSKEKVYPGRGPMVIGSITEQVFLEKKELDSDSI